MAIITWKTRVLAILGCMKYLEPKSNLMQLEGILPYQGMVMGIADTWADQDMRVIKIQICQDEELRWQRQTR